MSNTEQSSTTPSAPPTKRFYRFQNLISISYNVNHTIEAESFDAAMHLLDQICFDNVAEFDNIDTDDPVEIDVPRHTWECEEVDADGNEIEDTL